MKKDGWMKKILFIIGMLACTGAFARLSAGDGMYAGMPSAFVLQPQVDDEAPDFTLNSVDGKSLTLSSLRGKYVVLDFWGSWCAWCIKGFPEMKEAYAKYKGKMEIFGIACNDTEKRWKAALEKYQLPWLNVLNKGDVDVSALYAVEGYPTKVIISPEGKILKVVIGESPEFYTYLEKLFK